MRIVKTGAPQGPAGSGGCGGGSGQGVIGTIAITGAKSDQFTGSPFNIEGFDHEITSPRDPASGLPTGKQHKPITITAEGTTTVGTTITLTNASESDFSNQCEAA